MCGIAGMWAFRAGDGEKAIANVARMSKCLEHRGPDDRGLWADSDNGIALGHQRLSILDLSAAGHQPMASDDQRYQIVFNGEIYNFVSLKRELESCGQHFHSHSDTEVLLRGYAVWGDEVIDKLVGMFAFAIWDRDRRELTLARDRLGEKPLYYTATASGFTFASELGAMARASEVDRSIDQNALALYLGLQYIPAPYSIYRGVRKLLPGHVLKVSATGVVPRRYWDPIPIALQPNLRISVQDAADEIDRLLKEAVRGQMLADVSLGAFLSGGIDSTVIVSLMAELSATKVRTFTIGFESAQFDESRSAALVAEHLGTDHTVGYLTDADALALIPRIPAMYGEPFADASALPTHLVSRIAREHVTVSLSGDGGDEAFGGYGRYTQLEQMVRLGRIGAGPVAKLASSLFPNLPVQIHRAAPLLGRPHREVYRALMTFFEPADVQAMTGLAPAFEEYERAWTTAGRATLRQRARLSDLFSYLPEAILTKVDRAAMATSLETRAPFLDHRLMEFALRLPSSMLRDKHVLKKVAYRRVPKALLDRPKQGFGVPLAEWWRGALRETLMDVVTPSRMSSMGIRDTSVITRVIDEHLSGKRNHANRLWALYVLGMWGEQSKAW